MNDQKALELCDVVLEASKANQTEVRVVSGSSALTRFAGNAIHQNVAEEDTTVTARAVVGKQVGVAATSDVSREGLRELADTAYQLARLSAADEDFVSLPEPVPFEGETDFRDPETASVGPEGRAEAVRETIAVAAGGACTASGAYSVGDAVIAIANSLGVRTVQGRTSAELSVVVTGGNSSGYARTVSDRVADINAASLGRIAVEKCASSADPRDVEPGEWVVILEPEAVGDMIMMLGLYNFGALAMQEGRSFLATQLGQKVCGDNISIWDDGHDPRGQRMPYDMEGVPKQRVDLIARGVATSAVWDTYTGNKAGRASTGHSVSPASTWGPLPINMFIGTGESSVADMIGNTERGLLVTRFHYTNMVHPIKTVFTGMTRDGTFLIEDGQITGGVKNLRFTQSILEALSCVGEISRDGKLTDYVWAPSMKVNRFNFSSATEF